ncbi:ATP-binding cassette domain-containing protein [Mycoplasmatota bacterium]|nr:ATP-binding cassette domain-containing protein [Mycoplasmatota bacterium]
MSYALKINDIIKYFKDELVLSNITFKVNKGDIIGIVGRNGSGKSVLFKIICGLYLPSSGTVTVFDEEITNKQTYPKKTRAIIESPNFLGFYSGYKNLEYLALLSGQINKKNIEDTLALVGLEKSAWNKKVKHYSMGMKQKLGLAQVLMDNPQLIILDEPFNGLDESSVKRFHQILLDLKNKGVTILLASHIKEDIETLCDRVFKMDLGHLVEIS